MSKNVLPIIELDISQNGISKEGLIILFKALEDNTTLMVLKIGNNEAYNCNRLSKEGASSLKELLEKQAHN